MNTTPKISDCPNYDKSYGGCAVWGECLVENNRPCDFFDKFVEKSLTREAELLTTDEVAGLLKVSPATLVDWRHNRKGPIYYKMGREIRYKIADILTWEKQALVPIAPKEI